MKNNINLKMHAANMYKQTVKDASLTCSGYFNSLNIFTTDQISSLCSLEDFSPWEYQAFVNLAYLCIK